MTNEVRLDYVRVNLLNENTLPIRGAQIYLKLEFKWAKHIFPLYDHIEDTIKKIRSHNDVLQVPPDILIFT